MKKRFVFKAIVWVVLLLMLAGCKASSDGSGSTAFNFGSKASSTEQKIVGKWNGSIAMQGEDYTPFDGWIEMKNDLTGSFYLGETYTFTWSFMKMYDDTTYVYSVEVNEESLTLLMLYSESSELLSLSLGDIILFYKK